ncbi:hypothetical protein [Plastoroseomonas hellenica]|uniref:hypothetical protein n=1 Tax=Plastoroseomonas hellenica TaxID=2687306 RepID=UPI001BAC33FF|nr:hypothetical protein [Plastoroseomonas hellenica]MBR0646911.1 hypothetical protein [Plastoroseomonas hellenica]
MKRVLIAVIAATSLLSIANAAVAQGHPNRNAGGRSGASTAPSPEHPNFALSDENIGGRPAGDMGPSATTVEAAAGDAAARGGRSADDGAPLPSSSRSFIHNQNLEYNQDPGE